MLLQVITEHPEALPTIVSRTPVWVWALLTGLVVLGASQVHNRRVGLTRVLVMPVTMSILAVWGVIGAFGAQPGVIGAWCLLAITTATLLSRAAAPHGSRYDAVQRQFELRGSWIPLALILGIFLTKYIVGIDTAMDAQLKNDTAYALCVSAVYGLFSGVFMARAVRLLRLAFRPVNATLNHAR